LRLTKRGIGNPLFGPTAVSPAALAGEAQASTVIMASTQQCAAVGEVCFELIRARHRNNMI
jgi:hypothetical protein